MENNDTCVYLGEKLASYGFGNDHPFGPLRHETFFKEFKRKNLDEKVCIKKPVLAEKKLIELFHTTDYVERVIEQSSTGEGFLDYGDTPAFKGVYEAAAYVVGSVVDSIQHIFAGECNRAFVPIAGLHHARRNQAAGFCVFNDCGVAIEYIKSITPGNVLYVDIDAHHGDGVFYGFEDDPQVIFVDLHESGEFLYPGTGRVEECGTGEGEGLKLNIPLPPGANDETFLKAWGIAEKFINRFEFDFILLQCGADSIDGDPITHMKYSAQAHAKAAQRLKAIAKQKCQGRLLALGGGGYNHDNIAAAWTAVVSELANN